MNRTNKFFTVMMLLLASTIIMGACAKDDNDDNNIVNPPAEETVSLSNTQWYYESKDTLVMEEYSATIIYDLITTISFESDTNGIYMSDGIMEMEIDGESIEDVICNTDHFTYTFDGKQNGMMYMKNINNLPDYAFVPEYSFIYNKEDETLSLSSDGVNYTIFQKKTDE